MAHGGHCGGHSHSHYHGGRSGETSSWGEILCELGILAVILIIIAAVKTDSLKGRHPLEGTYEKYPSYVIDREEYFSDTRDMIDGLKYWERKTNVQIVVMSSSESWSDAKAVDKYYEMFDDESHVLIICPTAWYTSTKYYAIGDLADDVMDDTAMDYLLDSIDTGIRNGSKWREGLIELADMMIEN